MINFNFSLGIFYPKHRISFWDTYPHFPTHLCLETIYNSVLPKAKHRYKVQNFPFGIVSILLPTLADKVELMSIADSSRTVVSA